MAEQENLTEVIVLDMSPELRETLRAAQQRWKELEEAGTPYWCVHEGREVSDPRAHWQPDMWDSPRYDGIHGKHGVMCADCGGYIQEG